MRRVLMAAAAAAAIGLASPASAAVTFQNYNGPDLTTQIKASATDSTNNAPYVYGSTDNNGQSADVTFGGFNGSLANEAIHITGTNGGAGYASITDSTLNDINNFYALIVDVTSSDFNQYMFSVQLVNEGTINVYYLLSGGSWNYASLDPADPSAGIFQPANGNNTYVLQGGVFTAIMIRSTSPIKEFKQQSITLGSIPAPLPEPGTWALMLLGFGGIGLALRRGRRRDKPSLMQIA
jgi:PEP-CTERM motif